MTYNFYCFFPSLSFFVFVKSLIPVNGSWPSDIRITTSNNHRLESVGLNTLEELLRYDGNAQRR